MSVTVPPEIIREIEQAQQALLDAKEADGAAADSQATATQAQATADHDAATALTAHQTANEQAKEALDAVAKYLEQINDTPTSAEGGGKTPPHQPERVAGRTNPGK